MNHIRRTPNETSTTVLEVYHLIIKGENGFFPLIKGKIRIE
ncbi:TPA: hypothetical protein ACSPJ7_005597 [Bacillus cereus]